jgi:spore cortex biosynthesis protein YabQ
MTSLNEQWMTMLMMMLSGIGMGVVFDGYRVACDEFKVRRIFIPILDLLYWAVATIAVFNILSNANEGEVRAYVFIGLLLGILTHYWLFSRFVVRLTHGIIWFIRKVILVVKTIIHYVVVWPAILLYRLVKLLLAFLFRVVVSLGKIILIILKPFGLAIRWMTRPLYRPLVRWTVQGAQWLDRKLYIVDGFSRVLNWVTNVWNALFARSSEDVLPTDTEVMPTDTEVVPTDVDVLPKEEDAQQTDGGEDLDTDELGDHVDTDMETRPTEDQPNPFFDNLSQSPFAVKPTTPTIKITNKGNTKSNPPKTL